MNENIGKHHQHSRKRIQKLYDNYEPYPHSNNFIRNYDKFIYFVGIGTPVITSSQVFKIWMTQNAQGVSLIAWSAYLFNSLCWLYYGIIHNERPIIYTNIVCSLINILVILGIVIYG